MSSAELDSQGQFGTRPNRQPGRECGKQRITSDRLGITIPPLVQDYLSLGRFRDALVVHEEQQHPTASLAQFIKDNGLASQETGYRPIPASGPLTKEP